MDCQINNQCEYIGNQVGNQYHKQAAFISLSKPGQTGLCRHMTEVYVSSQNEEQRQTDFRDCHQTLPDIIEEGKTMAKPIGEGGMSNDDND